MKGWMVVGFLVLLTGLTACQEKDKPVWEGPFGLKEGVLFETFIKHYQTTSDKPNGILYETYQVPVPDNRFMHYELAFDPIGGLCKIVAHGKVVNSSADGKSVLAAFDQMNRSLEAVYGHSTDQFDFIQPDSKLQGKSQWMASLLAGHRVLASYWANGKRTRGGDRSILKLPHQLIMIAITARVYTPTTGAIDVEYHFSNHPQCELSAQMAR